MKNDKLSEAEAQRVREAFENVPFARLLGLKLGELGRGSATLHLELREELKRQGGLLHGGATASLIDTAAAMAVLTLVEIGKTATVDLTIHYLLPLLTGRATAHARVLRSGKRLSVVSVEVTDDKENLAATAITTYVKSTSLKE